MKSTQETARAVFGQRAAFYTTSRTHTDPKVLSRVVEWAAPEPTWRALDIGTGTGHTAFALAPHVAWVCGIDLTPQMLAEAEKLRRSHALDNVHWLLADAHRLPLPDQSFQLVTCRRTAHHFSDISAALAEMKRLLPPAGRLVIDDRSVPEDDFVDACMNQLDRYHDASHVRQYRPSEWRHMLEDLGFVVEALEPYIQHRPLSSLTKDVSSENVAQIHHILDGLNDAQRAAFNLVTRDGQQYLNHWYVMVAANLPADPH